MKTTENTIIVGIPYLARGAQGRELEYAVAGWLRHFKEDNFIIAVVGDSCPEVECHGRVIRLEAPRIETTGSEEYLPALDIVNKMKVLRCAFPEQKGFVWSADDIYAVNDFDLADIKFLKMLEPDMKTFRPDDSNPWRRMMARTRTVLQEDGLPTRNYSLHLPCWYDWHRMEEIVDRYQLTTRSLSVQNLYFNAFFPDRIPFRLCETDNIKLGVYRKRLSPEKIREALRSKIWVNNSVLGFAKGLCSELEKHYGIGQAEA